MIKFHFVAKVETLFVNEGGSGSSRVENTLFDLDPSANLKRSAYKNEDNSLTHEGLKMLTATLLSGLISSLFYGEMQGYYNADERVAFIHKELSRLFAIAREQPKTAEPSAFSGGVQDNDIRNIDVEPHN